MNGAKIYHSKSGTIETISNDVTFCFPAATLQFQRQPSSSFNSRFWVYYEVKSHKIMNLLKGRLSPDWAYARSL